MKKNLKNIMVVGFALFSMLFGAGNVIFPPYLGLGCGSQWVQGFLYYFLADIGLALCCLFAIARRGGHQGITGHLGKIPARILTTVIILCIGPVVGIPRAAASTFEMSVVPLLPGVNSVVFAVCFFLLIAVLCIRESAVVDIIGKMLTPMLLIGLLILIIKGVLTPLGPVPDRVQVNNVPVTGINAGYQTMDVLAVVIFGILISRSVKEKGYEKPSQQNRIILGSGLVAGVSLMIIYLGLTYLGVTATDHFSLRVEYTFLVTSIVHMLLGQAGTVIFAVVVFLACVTTAVALVSSCADYFSDLTGGKIPYVVMTAVICISSAVVTTFGLNRIISIAGPILDVVYPPTLFLIMLSFLDKWIHNEWVYRLGALGAFSMSLLSVTGEFGPFQELLRMLPFYRFGFGWILPALCFALLGALIPGTKQSISQSAVSEI